MRSRYAMRHWAATWVTVVLAAAASLPAQADPAVSTDGTAEETKLVWPVVGDPNTHPVTFAVQQALKDDPRSLSLSSSTATALQAYYRSSDAEPVWIGDQGLTARAEAAKAELALADHWGLEAKDYALPETPGATASAIEKAAFELKFGQAVVRYARHARQGRVSPTSVTRINDFPGLTADDVTEMYRTLGEAADVSAVLRGFHPSYPEFKRLRQALLKLRGVSENATQIETGALPTPDKNRDRQSETGAVTLPRGEELTPGMQHKDIVLLRARLGVPADQGANTHYFDAPLVTALEAFQREAGLVATGRLDQITRSRLNAALLPAEADDANEVEATANRDAENGASRGDARKIQLILNNMERWRWLPDDLGDLHVWNNVPEYQTRVFKGDKTVFSERIVVGLPSWATPSFMAPMKYIIFRPSWGVPRGIKAKELLPRLKKAQPQSIFDFFSGSSGASAVLKAYNLTVYRNGQVVDPSKINWNSSNIHNYSFVQPPGGKNPLGIVKFRFPNKHNVYMHDTIEPELFAKSSRAYSHGCIRVRNPVQLAEVLLYHDQGTAASSVRGMARSGRSITLKNEIPVYTTYMTARVDEDGNMRTYGDIYGRDGRLARQLGKSMGFDQPKVAKDNATSSTRRAAVKKKKRKKKKSAAYKRSRVESTVRNAISGRYH